MGHHEVSKEGLSQANESRDKRAVKYHTPKKLKLPTGTPDKHRPRLWERLSEKILKRQHLPAPGHVETTQHKGRGELLSGDNW